MGMNNQNFFFFFSQNSKMTSFFTLNSKNPLNPLFLFPLKFCFFLLLSTSSLQLGQNL